MISYNTCLISKSQEDILALKQILEWERFVFNEASKEQFPEKKNSIVVLHSKVYHKIRKVNPEIPSQVVIRGEQACLSSYRSIKSNKHKIKKPIEKNKLSIQLDKRLYSKIKNEPYSIKITTSEGRKIFQFHLYPKLKQLLDKHPYCDPKLYENNNQIFISFCFDNKPQQPLKQKLALGTDLGIRRSAATSEGKLIIDRKFNKEKRQIRFLKRKLQSKNTKSSRKHLNKIRHKERNKNKNQTHLIVNELLKTNADTIVLENLKSIKVKKHKYQNKNRISQVPLFELRQIISYKAENMGKTIILVCPSYSSQIDSITGKHEGERRGCRFYSKNGLVYDSDINAARNIGLRSKLPVSYGNILDGQALVTKPIVCKPCSQERVLQAPEFIRG